MFFLQFSLMDGLSDFQHIKVKDAKNYENFEATSSFLAANPLGRVDSVDYIHRYVEARFGSEKDFLFSNLVKTKDGFKCLDTPVSKDNVVAGEVS